MEGPLKSNISHMRVVKRDGRTENVSFDKILFRIQAVAKRLNLDRVNVIEIAKDTIQGLYDGITTEELDIFASNKCAENIITDPQYNNLAAGIAISNLHKTTSTDFMEVTDKLYNNTDNDGKSNPLINTEYYNFVKDNIDKINSALNYKNDYLFDYFAYKTLEKSYLMRVKDINCKNKHGKIVERPQHSMIRISLAIHLGDIDSALESYKMMSEHYFTHASPTWFNAGTLRQQLSSCFLLGMEESIEDISIKGEEEMVQSHFT